MSEAIRAQVFRISASTTDHLSAPFRRRGRRRSPGTTRPVPALKVLLPTLRYVESKSSMAGYIAVELTGCGSSTGGLQLNRLTAADIITSWTECVPVWGTGQRYIGSAVHQVRIQLLLPTPGRNSEHSSELAYQVLCDYCQRHIAQLARSRAYKENAQANVEHLSVAGKGKAGL